MLREHALRFELPFLEPLLQLINLSPSHRSHQNSYKNARCYSFLNEGLVKARKEAFDQPNNALLPTDAHPRKFL